MIDPFNLVVPPGPLWGQAHQELLFFSICVANAGAERTADQVNKLLLERSPFRYLQQCEEGGVLESLLQFHGIGCRKMKADHVRAVLKADYVNASYGDLTAHIRQIYNVCRLEKLVGPKTARMFTLYHQTHRQDIAVLDRHQLAWLKGRGHPGAPTTTPARGWAYNKWEQIYLSECRAIGLSPFEIDSREWRARARQSPAVE
jgi:thermostable 8-oxoguanine DNA glycosylase